MFVRGLLSRFAPVAPLLSLLLVLFVGCARTPDADSVADLGSIAEAAVTDAGADTVAECPGTGSRWIGRQDATITCSPPPTTDGLIQCPICPQPSEHTESWKSFRLFELHSNVQTSLPAQLAKYCVYEWTGSSKDDLHVHPVMNSSEISAWDEDTVTVAPLSTPGEIYNAAPEQTTPIGPETTSASPAPWLREWLRGSFRDLGRGGLTILPVGNNSRADVEIAILDTSPTNLLGNIPRGTSAHGHVVGWTARDLLCDDPMSVSCFGHINTYLAMPYVTTKQVDCVHGGAFGTRGELARQLYNAVETWKHSGSQRPHLVIPLALGWDEAFGSPGDPASLAVYDALTHASCQGVFIAAAAGNDTGGPMPAKGALYPAAWEGDPAPGFADCLSFEEAGVTSNDPTFDYSAVPQSGVAKNLLLSIGGIDRRGEPLSLTRPESLTQLVALAFQADAGDPSQPLPRPLTGTSIGVTVAGAAAAAVWAYDPTLNAREVAGILVNTASPLSGPYPGLSAPKAGVPRRVSLCDAIVKACFGNPSGNNRCPTSAMICSASGSQDDVNFPSPLKDAINIYFADVLNHVWDYSAMSYHDLYTAPTPNAWTYPQPVDPGCSVCMFRRNSGLYMEFDRSIPMGITLTLYFGPGISSTTYSIITGSQRSIRVPISSVTTVGAMISWPTPGGSIAEEIPVVN